ncbi:MAG: RagB/SusD family nutrient uptake outer membrane protein [Bacteroidales bacterium]|nr:RagB/SusD family nutrient uptake outer membrane protein [Bacteroidales bacterium]
MKRIFKTTAFIAGFGSLLFLTGACEQFLNPEQEIKITEDRLYDDWYEYRSIEMGLYGLQQQLVEQLLLLGELRGDLMEITENADADMVEIYNFNVSKTNKYAAPTNFFRLIAACNNFIRVLKTERPEVLDHSEPVNNYDRLYGEALTMRAWAYFNAVRIYGKVPFIPESLTTLEEVAEFVNTPGTYIDSVHVLFGKDGYYKDPVAKIPQDTIEVYEIPLEKKFYDETMIIDYFTDELENDIKAVGVNHYIDNNDNTWDVIVWREFGFHALLGHMYLTRGDYASAYPHFKAIIFNTTENLRYHLDESFSTWRWPSIFTNIDIREHIYTIWFNKANFQQNSFQEWFENWGPHKYMLKPSYPAIKNWESQWRGVRININNSNKSRSNVTPPGGSPGIPADYFRGMGASYIYMNGSVPITENEMVSMLYLRMQGDDRNSRAIMENMDTLIFKYSIGKNTYDQDANYIIYRAAGIHLYLAEAYIYWVADHENDQSDLIKPIPIRSINIVNDGRIYTESNSRPEMGVRGRVGLGASTDGMSISNDYFIHDPYTNKIIGYENLEGKFARKQEIWEKEILDERALELAYEGERFYDLMRFAKRNNKPEILADRVAAKFPAGRREQIRALLMDESNWYINWFDE